MTDIILTLDYEIFGNGAGDVRRDMIEPTSRVLEICDRHGAKMTIMLEVGEYWAFQTYDEQLRKDWGYSPAGKIKSQAIDIVERGHDVQLHLHPQWIGARYDRHGWQVSETRWRLADLPDGVGDETHIHSIAGALSRGKQTLEGMIRGSKPDYRCACFRAGGFYAQPSGPIIQAMKGVGILLDSSVVKGFRKHKPFLVDYSDIRIPGSCWWTTEEQFTAEGDPGANVLELPVSSQMEPYWSNLRLTKLHTTLKRRRRQASGGEVASCSKDLKSVPTLTTVLSNLFRRHCSMFDYCKLTCTDMLRRIDTLRNTGGPIVLIGHSKDFFNKAHFERFLATVSQDADVRFPTFSEYLQGSTTHMVMADSGSAGDDGLYASRGSGTGENPRTVSL